MQVDHFKVLDLIALLPNLRVVASRPHMNDATRDYIGKLSDPILISAGSSLKFMAPGKRRRRPIPTIYPMHGMDTAADVIVGEVGLSTVDTATRRPLV